MSHGYAVAAGTEREIIGTTTAVEVDTSHWAEAFAALDRAGFPVTLNGTRVRLADTPPTTVRAERGPHTTLKRAPGPR
ncbi:hypothetical protein ACH4M4_19240 [Streptomyces sp. NPDC017254]|uniref:hypothetical protein n=1 Tax=unclassified Streptomyces TaxID=2593676 RepID=UPI0037896D61